MQTLTTGLASLSARRTSSGTTPRNVVRCRAPELRARRSAWSGRGVHVRVVRDQSCVARPGHLLTKVADGSVRCEVGVRPTLSRRRLGWQSAVVSRQSARRRSARRQRPLAVGSRLDDCKSLWKSAGARRAGYEPRTGIRPAVRGRRYLGRNCEVHVHFRKTTFE